MLLTLFSGENEGLLFGVFGVIIILFLLVDLGFFHKAHQKVTQREALLQSLFWVAVSVCYGMVIYFYGEGPTASFEFFSAYVTEKALSIDNIFVILLILRYFNVKEEYYHNILFGDTGSHCISGHFHIRGGIPHRTVPLDTLHLRSIPDLLRGEDLQRRRGYGNRT